MNWGRWWFETGLCHHVVCLGRKLDSQLFLFSVRFVMGTRIQLGKWNKLLVWGGGDNPAVDYIKHITIAVVLACSLEQRN